MHLTEWGWHAENLQCRALLHESKDALISPVKTLTLHHVAHLPVRCKAMRPDTPLIAPTIRPIIRNSSRITEETTGDKTMAVD